MATKEVIENVQVEKEISIEEPFGTINSGEDTGKDSDIDMIFEEMARENAGICDSNNGSSTDKLQKPKAEASVKPNTLKKPVRGRFVRRGTGRGFMNRVVKLRLPKIPQGILYVKNGTYIGYHCTYCNCALKTLLSVKQHVAGARHRETLNTKKIKEESETGNKDGLSSASSMKTLKNDVESSLVEYLATATEPIVGLGHIVETIIPNKPPMFECNMCNFTSNADEIKEHIIGTRHRLMYLKTIDPKKLAEMMTKNLNKNERNQKIIDNSKELEEEHGRGSIVVKNLGVAETQDDEQKRAKLDSKFHKPRRSRSSIRRAQEWVHGRGRGLLRGGRIGSIRRGMRGIRGGRGSSNRGGGRGNLNREGGRGNLNRGGGRGNLNRGGGRGNLNRGGGRGNLNRGGGRGNLNRGGGRGNLNRGNTFKRPLSRMNESRKQTVAKQFRGRGSRGASEPYHTRDSYYTDYANWIMRSGNDSYETYYGSDSYYPDPYSMSREHYMEDQYERIDRRAPRKLYPSYDYGQRYEDESPRQYESPSGFRSREPQSASPSRNRSSYRKAESTDVDANSLKNLPSFNLTNEKDAGLVMNVITSLAESLLGYKMGGSGSPQEILRKLEDEKKKFSGHSDESGTRATEKFSKANDIIDAPLHSWGETGETRTRHSDTYDRTLSPPRRQMDSVRDRSPPRRPVDVVRDRSPPPPRRLMDIDLDRSPPPPRRTMDVMQDRSPPPPPRRPMDDVRDRSPPAQRRPLDVMRDRSPPAQRRSLDVMRDRSPPAQRRQLDVMRDISPPAPRRPMDVMRDRSPPIQRRPMDVMQDRSSAPRRTMDVMQDQSLLPSRRPMDMRDRSPPPKRPIDVIQDQASSLSRAMDVMRNRSPPRGPTGLRNRSPLSARGSVGIMRDRSPPPLRNHPSYVDDMFDNYQKSQSAVRGTYASTSSNTPGYRSSFSSPSNYGTPASYPSPSFSTNSSFNRSSETRRLTPTGSFVNSQERNVLDWKYRSLR